VKFLAGLFSIFGFGCARILAAFLLLNIIDAKHELELSTNQSIISSLQLQLLDYLTIFILTNHMIRLAGGLEQQRGTRESCPPSNFEVICSCLVRRVMYR
jgi:uncharacterized membrane protein